MIEEFTREQLRLRQTVLCRALRSPPSEWPGLLDSSCGEDSLLRAVLERDFADLPVALELIGQLDVLEEQDPEGLDDSRQSSDSDRTRGSHSNPDRIGPYRILSRLGEGGMGTVFRAEQEVPIRRPVALKIVQPGLSSDAALERFRGERLALASMNHDGIARVYDAGVADDGRPYIAMELVEGKPLLEALESHPLTMLERVELFVRIGEAVQHAHRRGILHRDLKPANILLSRSEGRSTPKIIDFGIAQAIEGRLHDATLTGGSGTRIGTVAYMSPERLTGDGFVDVRSDVYSLGVTLYEVLTGRRAHPGETPETVARSVLESTPTSPRRIDRSIPFDLETVVLVAIARDPRERYATVDALVQDLRRVLGGLPVTARRAGPAVVLGRWVQRHRALVTGVVASAAVALVAVVAILLHFNGVLGERASELLRRTLELERVRYAEVVRRADVAIGEGELDRARELLESQSRALSFETLAGFEYGHLWRALHPEEQAITCPDVRWTDAQFLPDGRGVAIVGALQAQHRSLVGIWDRQLRRFRANWPREIENPASSLTVSRDGRTLYVLEDSGHGVHSFDLASGESTRFAEYPAGRGHLQSISPDGELLGTIAVTGVVFFGARVGRALALVPSTEIGRRALFLWDRNRLLLGTDQSISLHAIPSIEALLKRTELQLQLEPLVQRINPSPLFGLGRVDAGVVAAYGDGTLVLCDLDTLEPLGIESRHPGVQTLAVSPDRTLVATAGDDLRVVVRDARSLEPIWVFRGPTRPLGAIDFAPDGRALVSVSASNVARIWSLDDLRRASNDGVAGSKLWGTRFRSDGALVTEGAKLELELWDAAGGRKSAKLVRTSRTRETPWESDSEAWQSMRASEMFRLSPDGRSCAVSTATNGVRLRALDFVDASVGSPASAGADDPPAETSGAFVELERFSHPVYGMGFSRDGEWFFAASLLLGDRSVDAHVRGWRRVPRSSSPGEWSVAFEARSTAIGRTILIAPGKDLVVWGGRHDTPIEVWRLSSAEKLAAVKAQAFVSELCLRPDEEQFVTAGNDGSLRFWDSNSFLNGTPTGEDLTLFGHRGRINCLEFLPNGHDLLTGPHEGDVKLWRLAEDQGRLTAEEMLSLAHPAGGVKALAVAPDGQAIAAVGGMSDGKAGWIRVWYADAVTRRNP